MPFSYAAIPSTDCLAITHMDDENYEYYYAYISNFVEEGDTRSITLTPLNKYLDPSKENSDINSIDLIIDYYLVVRIIKTANDIIFNCCTDHPDKFLNMRSRFFLKDKNRIHELTNINHVLFISKADYIFIAAFFKHTAEEIQEERRNRNRRCAIM